ncbi:MAG: ABC transporter ATP-binding protein [Rickettsiaceae bacterium]|nr:ABC transporter ATP-binding protein [Rickettsiaceae bacterium]
MKEFDLKKFAENDSKSLFTFFRLYKHFIYNRNKKHILSLCFLIFIAGLAPVIDSLFLQSLTDSIEFYVDNDSSDILTVSLKWVIAYLLWWEGCNYLWRSYDYLYLRAAPKMKADVINDFYNYVQFHSHNFFQSNLAGDISNRITEAASSLEWIFASINEKIFRKLVMLLTTIGALYWVNPIIALIFVVWLSVFLGISIFFSKRINKYSVKFNKDKANVAGKIVDSIANISAVRIFSAQKFETRYLNRAIDGVIASDRNLQWFMLKLRYVLSISCSTMIGFLIYYTISLRSDNLISTGQCVMIITLCTEVVSNVWDLTQDFGDLFEYIGSFNQSLSLFKEYEIVESETAKDLVITDPQITFNKVCFDYKQNYNHFENQSLIIPAYQRVGLVGFSASGKTTFTRMINRTYNIRSGEIIIDQYNINDFSLESLNRNISVIPQEPILFHRTIRENIAYAKPDSSEEEIINAASLAHMHEHIMRLPEQYDTICGERGNNLSGGQRQRISIARAFLEDAPILIIDEATSSLDSHTEKLIQESLNILMQGRTVIVIAHRLSTLLNMDRILVFDKGQIVEDGTHEELLQRGKLYKLLWNHYRT